MNRIDRYIDSIEGLALDPVVAADGRAVIQSRRPSGIDPGFAREFAKVVRVYISDDFYTELRADFRTYLIELLRACGVEVDHFVTLRGLADVLDELAERQTVKAA